MKYATSWKDYSVIATGDGEKLERWGEYYLLRPDPQVIWHGKQDLASYPKLSAHYLRSSSGGGPGKILNSLSNLWGLNTQGYFLNRQSTGRR